MTVTALDFRTLDFGPFAENRPQHIRPRLVVARSEAEADFFGGQIFHRAETLREFRQQRRARGRDEFVRLVALREADAARAEDGERRGHGHGKPAMRAFHPARAFHHRRGQHARLAEQFERDARAHNVHDGIHRADFVKMNLVRRQPVDFSFRLGNALENGDGFLFHPRGKFAARNEFLDFGKIPVSS